MKNTKQTTSNLKGSNNTSQQNGKNQNNGNSHNGFKNYPGTTIKTTYTWGY